MIVRNNRVHDFGQSGIVGSECDCITVADNIVYSNGFYSIWVGWGIVFWQPRPLVQAAGYKIVIRGNRVFDNWSYVPYVDKVLRLENDVFRKSGYDSTAS